MSSKSPLLQMSENTITDYWNDSCIESELEYALAHGAVGATTNPVIVFKAIQSELAYWQPQIIEIVRAHPTATEDEIAWKVMELVATTRAKHLEAIFVEHKGQKGRLSIQTSPKYANHTARLVEQAEHFHSLFPNNNVKIPATEAGIKAIEEVSARGISINATVSYTVAQAIAVAEAVERGGERGRAAGHDPSRLASVCTLMGGRLDEWLKHVAVRDTMAVAPEPLEWAGVAVIKRAYRIYKERGYRTRLLSAATRNHYHWSELIGMDGVVTIPTVWARRINNSSITAEERIERPVSPAYIEQLSEQFVDFRRAYEDDGLSQSEFADYGPCALIISQFLGGYADLLSLLRQFTTPLPTA